MTDPKVRELDEPTIEFTERIIRRMHSCDSIAAKLILMRDFYAKAYERGLREGREQAAKLTEDWGSWENERRMCKLVAASIRQGGVEK